jgi:hypothetical protein
VRTRFSFRDASGPLFRRAACGLLEGRQFDKENFDNKFFVKTFDKKFIVM